ncbi:MAG: class I SAM-dependent methyltransferase [Clostridiales bacterium]|nr:class I SAM-dependent methyltransferase [Clostridiales bacterium]
MEDKNKEIIEEIGKIKLDLSQYPGEDYYCDGEIEDELLNIARNYSEVEYQKIIEARRSWPILYHLSPFRENIVEWLPIDKSMKVLEIGAGCGAITGALSRKAKEVTCIELSKKRSMINAYRHMDCDNVTIHVGNFQDIETTLPCDYDYICLIGVFEYGQAYIDSDNPYEDFLNIIAKHRKEGGHIVIAIENKLGLKYWAGCKEDHLGTWFDSLEDYPKGSPARTFTKDGLVKIAKNCGFSEISIYYPYPDYKFMTHLYSDERLPKLGELSASLRNFDRDRMQLFDEKLVFDTLIKEGQFPLFSNSYMMVLGSELRIKYAKYSNDRADSYKIKTLVTHNVVMPDKQGRNVVKQIEKHALSKEAQQHVIQMEKAYEGLSRRFDGGKLLINRCALAEAATGASESGDEGLYAVFEYLEGRTLEELLDECLAKNDMDKFHALFNEYLECISYNTEMAVTDYDLIFSNILVAPDGKWHVIDYEWTFGKQVEVKEIAFRAVYCYLLENEKRNKLDFDFILNKLNVTQEDAEQFRHNEKEFQKYVTERKRSMIEIRDIIGQPVYDVEGLIEDKIIEKRKNKVQIYEDMGEGFSEQNSFFPDELPLKKILEEELYASEEVEKEYFTEQPDTNGREFRVKIAAGRKSLRLDPCSDSCVVWLKEMKWNDMVIPSKSKCISTNGFRVGDNLYAFDTIDPNITIQVSELEQRQENFLQVSMQVTRMPAETVAHMNKKEQSGLAALWNR